MRLYFYFFYLIFIVILACWHSNSHERPSFKDILILLDQIKHSAFTQTPHESFHTLQDVWKVEIEQVLDELKMKEKVKQIILRYWFLDDEFINVKFTKQ